MLVWHQCFRGTCCVYSLKKIINSSFSLHNFTLYFITQPRLHALAYNVRPSSCRLHTENSLEHWNIFAFHVLWRSDRSHILLYSFSGKCNISNVVLSSKVIILCVFHFYFKLQFKTAVSVFRVGPSIRRWRLHVPVKCWHLSIVLQLAEHKWNTEREC